MRALLLAAILLAPVAGWAQAAPPAPATAPAPPYRRIVPPALAAEAKIAEEAALALALSRVPGGQVLVLELEREEGKLIYAFDIKVPGKPGTYEVEIDAITGRVVRIGHER
jgi:uncharacterized membrane protein YkoI